MAFNQGFEFGRETIVLQHKGGGDYNQHLRASPKNDGSVCHGGGQGAWAQWVPEPHDSGSKCRFKNVKTGKYLRILNNDNVDVGGGQGPWTLFRIHRVDADKVKLESNEMPGKYIAVGAQNEVRIGNGGPWTVIRALRR